MASIIQELISSIDYEAHLKRNKDWESGWENVRELIHFANESAKAVVDPNGGDEIDR